MSAREEYVILVGKHTYRTDSDELKTVRADAENPKDRVALLTAGEAAAFGNRFKSVKLFKAEAKAISEALVDETAAKTDAELAKEQAEAEALQKAQAEALAKGTNADPKVEPGTKPAGATK